jgi:hypothetical protein
MNHANNARRIQSAPKVLFIALDVEAEQHVDEPVRLLALRVDHNEEVLSPPRGQSEWRTRYAT